MLYSYHVAGGESIILFRPHLSSPAPLIDPSTASLKLFRRPWLSALFASSHFGATWMPLLCRGVRCIEARSLSGSMVEMKPLYSGCIPTLLLLYLFPLQDLDVIRVVMIRVIIMNKVLVHDNVRVITTPVLHRGWVTRHTIEPCCPQLPTSRTTSMLHMEDTSTSWLSTQLVYTSSSARSLTS